MCYTAHIFPLFLERGWGMGDFMSVLTEFCWVKYGIINSKVHYLGSDDNISVESSIQLALIGESSFTLFALLTYAYRYLITLIKEKL